MICTCDGAGTPANWCSPASWGAFTVCGVVGGGEGMCKTIVSDGKKSIIGYERNLDGVSREVVYYEDCVGNEISLAEALEMIG